MSIQLYICRFFLEAFFSMVVMGFSMFMIVFRDDMTNIFLPIITGILGYWLPSPKLGASKLMSLANKNIDKEEETDEPPIVDLNV